MSEPSLQYRVFIKVPFSRGSFVDPPDSNWTSAKDKNLWRILSSATKGKDLDWHGLADKFDVTLPFLLQQAAWLYERQLSQVREQLKRVNKPSTSANPSPSPPPQQDASTITATTALETKIAQGDALSSHVADRPKSNLTLRTKRGDEVGRSSPAGSPILDRPQRVPYSRTTSANTITQLQKSSVSPITVSGAGARSPTIGEGSIIRRGPASTRQLVSPTDTSPKASPSPSESSSDDDDAPPLAQSRAFQRRPRFSSLIAKGKGRAHVSRRGLDSVADNGEDSEDDSDEGFLPFAATPAPQIASAKTGLARTGATPSKAVDGRDHGANPPSHANTQRTPRQSIGTSRPHPPGSISDSANLASASESASPTSNASHSSPGASASASHPSLPPNDHRNALAALSPRQRRSIAREGSDTGTPSMGSSFSDLDDASVSMSAMEEAMAQQMRAGGGAASTIRGSLALGMNNVGNLWKGRGGGGNGGGQGRGQQR